MSCPHLAKTKQDELVGNLSDKFTGETFVWPSVTDVTTKVYNADYNEYLTKVEDLHEEEKVLCANGYVATVKIEWFQSNPYTGLFQRADNGLIRLSSATMSEPGSWASRTMFGSCMFPCVALKFFRSNVHTGNLLFAGKKTGQENDLFFQNAVCNHLTDKIPFLFQWVHSLILQLFSKYSQYPTKLGVSDFAAFDQNGKEISKDEISFPWCIALCPPNASSIENNSLNLNTESIKTNMTLDKIPFHLIPVIPVGTVLYDIFVIPTPSDVNISVNGRVKLERIGRVISTSEFKATDKTCGLFFKHQRKEEDYLLKPDWLGEINDRHGLIGSSFIQKLVEVGKYIDFEGNRDLKEK